MHGQGNIKNILPVFVVTGKMWNAGLVRSVILSFQIVEYTSIRILLSYVQQLDTIEWMCVWSISSRSKRPTRYVQ